MARFSLANLFGDPFALVTVSISIIGIVVSLIASIMVNLHDSYPNYAWWSIAFMICITAGVIFIIGTNKIHLYGTALVGYLSASFVFTTLAVNSFIYSSQKPADQAAAAGFILLCAVNAVWIFYFGSATQSSARKFLDSYSLQKEVPRYDTGSKVSGFHARPETTTSHPPQMYTSQISGGFEASTPLSGFPSAPSGPNRPISPGAPISPALHQDDAEVSQPTEYPYRAKAIYSYEANPDDANEISFTKHEILEVSDVSGRWWQARKTNGDVGIAPSNYLILL